MKRLTLGTLSLATLALSACLLTAVQATTASPLTLVQQAKKADVIVQATIGTPTTVTEGGQAYSVYPLKVSETLAGDAAQLPQLPGGQGGGGPALYVLSGMELAPVFQSGQEAVLLLYKGRLDSPLVGFNQGAFLISNGLVSVLPIQPVPGQGGAVPGASSTPFGTPPTPAAQDQPVQTPVAQTPATSTPATSTPATQTPATQTPATQTPATQTPATSTPATSTPATSTPATSTPATPTPATPSPGSQTPGTETPATQPQTPAASTPTASTPAVQPAPVATVLGNLKTPAELKAAIVAARAAK